MLPITNGIEKTKKNIFVYSLYLYVANCYNSLCYRFSGEVFNCFFNAYVLL